MSDGVPKSRVLAYLGGFACLVVAIGALAVSGLTRSLGSGYSLTAIAFAIGAIALGAASLRR